MEIDAAALERLPAGFRDAARRYADHFRELADDRLRALAFYGPVTMPGFDEGRDPAWNIAILEPADLDLLRQLARDGRRFAKKGIAAPVIMTPEYIRDSLDTFPLELIEIQQHHVTLVGRAPFGELRFEAEHVRLQCERELKMLLVCMRQGLLAAAGHERALAQLEVVAAQTLIRTLRGMLWLKDRTDLNGSDEILSAIEQLVDRELSAVRAVGNPATGKGWDHFVALYEDLEYLRRKADAW